MHNKVGVRYLRVLHRCIPPTSGKVLNSFPMPSSGVDVLFFPLKEVLHTRKFSRLPCIVLLIEGRMTEPLAGSHVV